MNARTSGSNAFDRLRATVEAAGLNWRELEAGNRASFQTPGHSERDLGTSAAYNGKQVLLYSHNGDTAETLAALGLAWRDLYDKPTGVVYRYTDARQVFRTPQTDTPKAKFRQSGNTKGAALYGIEHLDRDLAAPVYVVEGEKDVDTARALWDALAVSQAMGASQPPANADWSKLLGRNVIIVADKDAAGRKRAANVYAHLASLGQPEVKLSIVEAAEGKDLSDHIAAGHGPGALAASEAQPLTRRITLVPASKVKTERLDWLIPNWIPKRSLTLLAGREGLGKSTIACAIAAQASRGELDGAPMNVAYLATEDSRSITVKPRLEAAGADLNRIFFFDVTTETGGAGALTLPGDTALLGQAIADNDVHLVILDAAKSAMHSSLDGYRDDDVRQFLEPLAALADRQDLAILALVHFGKRESADSGKLILGSIAWSQIARSVLSVAAKDDGGLVVTNTKGNLAPATISREVRIESAAVPTDDGGLADVGRAVWGDETDLSAADLLGPQDSLTERGEIEAVVLDYLERQGGSAPAKDVLKACRAAGLNENTVKNVRRKIGVQSVKAGFGGGWLWTIEVPETFQDHTEEPCTREEVSSVSWQETSVPSPPDELQTIILAALSTDRGMSPKTIQASVPAAALDKYKPADHLANVLAKMVAAGTIGKDSRGRYRKPKAAA